MKKNVLILAMALLLLVIPFSSAIEDLGTFAKDENITLIQNCDCDSVNITSILKPDGTAVSLNAQMQKDGSLFTYNLSSSRTDQLGVYKVNGEGNPSGSYETFSYSFSITTSGNNITTGQGILYFGLMFLLTAFFAAAVYMTVITPFGDFREESTGDLAKVNYNKYLKFLYGFLSYVLLMFIMFTGKGVTGEYAALDTAYQFFNAFSSILVAAIGPLIIASVFFIAFNIATDKKNAKALARGLPHR